MYYIHYMSQKIYDLAMNCFIIPNETVEITLWPISYTIKKKCADWQFLMFYVSR